MFNEEVLMSQSVRKYSYHFIKNKKQKVMFLSFLVIVSWDELMCYTLLHEVKFSPAIYFKVQGPQRLETDYLTS